MVCEERVLCVVPGIEAPLHGAVTGVIYAFNMEYPAAWAKELSNVFRPTTFQYCSQEKTEHKTCTCTCTVLLVLIS